MWFWGSSNSLGERDRNPGLISTYGTGVRRFVETTPKDFEFKFGHARPYVFTSFIAWPTFWIYRSLDWRRKRTTNRLISYINRTFFQAKLIQLGIIALGFVAAATDGKQPLGVLHHVNANFMSSSNVDIVFDTYGIYDE